MRPQARGLPPPTQVRAEPRGRRPRAARPARARPRRLSPPRPREDHSFGSLNSIKGARRRAVRLPDLTGPSRLLRAANPTVIVTLMGSTAACSPRPRRSRSARARHAPQPLARAHTRRAPDGARATACHACARTDSARPGPAPLLGSDRMSVPIIHNIRVAEEDLALWFLTVPPMAVGCFACRPAPRAHHTRRAPPASREDRPCARQSDAQLPHRPSPRSVRTGIASWLTTTTRPTSRMASRRGARCRLSSTRCVACVCAARRRLLGGAPPSPRHTSPIHRIRYLPAKRAFRRFVGSSQVRHATSQPHGAIWLSARALPWAAMAGSDPLAPRRLACRRSDRRRLYMVVEYSTSPRRISLLLLFLRREQRAPTSTWAAPPPPPRARVTDISSAAGSISY